MSNLGNKEIMAKNIKYYMNKFGKDRNDMCRDLNIKYTTLTDWINGKSYPRIDKIELMANYFNIPKSSLVEETNFFSDDSMLLNRLAKDEKDISKKLNIILNEMENNDALMFDGETLDMDEESRELLKASLENTLRLAKKLAKEKYTPNKYKR